MKIWKIVYWISTILICLLMLASAGMYLLNYQVVAQIFTNLGHPTHVIYPLAIAKILGVTAILSNYSKSLKEWAYAGFFFDFVLAFMAHYFVADGGIVTPVVALGLLLTSYFSDKKIG
jgi:hypothetical protein